MTDWNEKFRLRLLELDVETLADMYYRLRMELVKPPEGWFNFGYHVDKPEVALEFWGIGDDYMPIWERPIPRKLFPGIPYSPYVVPRVGDYPPFQIGVTQVGVPGVLMNQDSTI